MTSTNLPVASRSDSAASSSPRPTRSSAIVGRFPTSKLVSGGVERGTSCTRICCSSCSQLRTRLETQLVGQPSPHALVGRKGIGLATLAVQRGDQAAPTGPPDTGAPPTASFELTDRVADVVTLEACGHLRLEQLDAGLLEPRSVRSRPLTVARAEQDLPSILVQRGGAEVRRGAVVAIFEQPRRDGRVAHHRERVHIRRIDNKRIATVAADDG